MRPVSELLRRALLPVTAFVAVLAVHFVWLGFFPEENPIQSQWLSVVPETAPSPLQTYIETQSYWLGYSYALAFAFAVVALRWFLERSSGASKGMAIGSLTFSGFLAVAGCFLIGCCGSPMLIVYMNLFGTAFLPLAKPIMAGITTVTIILSWLWMRRKRAAELCCADGVPAGKSGCYCKTG